MTKSSVGRKGVYMLSTEFYIKVQCKLLRHGYVCTPPMSIRRRKLGLHVTGLPRR
jgi:hypothetical protein